MTLKHLRIFVTVCECNNSITKASKQLYLAQPSVSLAIKELELHYNQKLFERIGRRLYLTSMGRLLLDKAKKTLNLVEEMESLSKGENYSYVLNIGSSITIGTHWLPGIVSAFYEKHPQVTVRVKVHNSQEIERMLLSGEIDLGFIEGAVHSNQIMSLPFLEDQLVVICSANHAFAQRDLLTLKEIQQQPFALREQGSASRELIDYTMASQGFHINPLWECISTQAIVQAVKRNLCISILPKKMIQEELHTNDIVMLKVKDLELYRKYFMLYHKNKEFDQALQNFINTASETAYEHNNINH